jgi:hypothetical protein
MSFLAIFFLKEFPEERRIDAELGDESYILWLFSPSPFSMSTGALG